jgi:hypothetical protein
VSAAITEYTKKNLSVSCGLLLSIACSTENTQRQTSTPAAGSVATINVADANGPKASDPADSTHTVDIDALESTAIHSVSNIVSRAGPELRIRLLNGRTAVFKDDTTAGVRFALPRYAAYLRAIHSHVIHQYPYEGEGIYLVVDDSTADSTIVFGIPVVSPDGRRFALTSMTGLDGGNPGLIEVWRMVGRKPEKEFSHDTEDEPWEPSDAVWLDPMTVGFSRNTHNSPADPYVQTPGRLKWTGSTWVLSDSRH